MLGYQHSLSHSILHFCFYYLTYELHYFIFCLNNSQIYMSNSENKERKRVHRWHPYVGFCLGFLCQNN